MFALKSVDGVYRNGSIELASVPQGVVDDTAVIVTFLNVPLAAQPRDGEDAPQRPPRSAPRQEFAQGWQSPEMETYHEKADATVLMW